MSIFFQGDAALHIGCMDIHPPSEETKTGCQDLKCHDNLFFIILLLSCFAWACTFAPPYDPPSVAPAALRATASSHFLDHERCEFVVLQPPVGSDEDFAW